MTGVNYHSYYDNWHQNQKSKHWKTLKICFFSPSLLSNIFGIYENQTNKQEVHHHQHQWHSISLFIFFKIDIYSVFSFQYSSFLSSLPVFFFACDASFFFISIHKASSSSNSKQGKYVKQVNEMKRKKITMNEKNCQTANQNEFLLRYFFFRLFAFFRITFFLCSFILLHSLNCIKMHYSKKIIEKERIKSKAKKYKNSQWDFCNFP